MQDLLNMLPKVSGRAGGGRFKVEGTNKPEKEFAKRMRAPKRPNPMFLVCTSVYPFNLVVESWLWSVVFPW